MVPRPLTARLALAGALAGAAISAAPGPSGWLSRFGTVAAFQTRGTPSAETLKTGEATARVQCVTCHKLPPPDVLPRASWRDEIAKMFLILNKQPEPGGPPGTVSRNVTFPPDWEAMVAYYEMHAPVRLAPPAKWPAPDSKVAFRRRTIPTLDGSPPPAVANIRLLHSSHPKLLDLVLSDMRSGVIATAMPYEEEPRLKEIARLGSPAHIAPYDLDHDGAMDFLIADLGLFQPGDHHKGAVVWLRGKRDGSYSAGTLTGWPRVADVEAADFDGDGKPDLAVAAFGWRRTGDFTILKNTTTDYDSPGFTPIQVDPRPGAIHTIPVDLNRDGLMDVVVLFSQEHETVVAFINQGGMRFQAQTIYAAPHPNWGSSGIEVVDLDDDGRLDVLLTHGDSFDDQLVKPYHGIQWLENRGTFPFEEHTLAELPGVQRAQTVDLDGDGDLDIVACTLSQPGDPVLSTLPSLVWLEQTDAGKFERHVIEVGTPNHATLDVGDFDGDGDIDIVVGDFSFGEPLPSAVEIFENRRVRGPGTATR